MHAWSIPKPFISWSGVLLTWSPRTVRMVTNHRHRRHIRRYIVSTENSINMFILSSWKQWNSHTSNTYIHIFGVLSVYVFSTTVQCIHIVLRWHSHNHILLVQQAKFNKCGEEENKKSKKKKCERETSHQSWRTKVKLIYNTYSVASSGFDVGWTRGESKWTDENILPEMGICLCNTDASLSYNMQGDNFGLLRQRLKYSSSLLSMLTHEINTNMRIKWDFHICTNNGYYEATDENESCEWRVCVRLDAHCAKRMNIKCMLVIN